MTRVKLHSGLTSKVRAELTTQEMWKTMQAKVKPGHYLCVIAAPTIQQDFYTKQYMATALFEMHDKDLI